MRGSPILRRTYESCRVSAKGESSSEAAPHMSSHSNDSSNIREVDEADWGRAAIERMLAGCGRRCMATRAARCAVQLSTWKFAHGFAPLVAQSKRLSHHPRVCALAFLTARVAPASNLGARSHGHRMGSRAFSSVCESRAHHLWRSPYATLQRRVRQMSGDCFVGGALSVRQMCTALPLPPLTALRVAAHDGDGRV